MLSKQGCYRSGSSLGERQFLGTTPEVQFLLSTFPFLVSSSTYHLTLVLILLYFRSFFLEGLFPHLGLFPTLCPISWNDYLLLSSSPLAQEPLRWITSVIGRDWLKELLKANIVHALQIVDADSYVRMCWDPCDVLSLN